MRTWKASSLWSKTQTLRSWATRSPQDHGPLSQPSQACICEMTVIDSLCQKYNEGGSVFIKAQLATVGPENEKHRLLNFILSPWLCFQNSPSLLFAIRSQVQVYGTWFVDLPLRRWGSLFSNVLVPMWSCYRLSIFQHGPELSKKFKRSSRVLR